MQKKTMQILAFVIVGAITLSGCTKDKILGHYNNVIQ